MLLVIAGFHRSGTSMTAQLLRAAGLFVGDELLGATPENPYGHFEDLEVLGLHQQLLGVHGEDWQWDLPFPFRLSDKHRAAMSDLIRRREASHRLWGFKDPRVCLLLGFWKHIARDMKTLMIYRDPGECVQSLERRHARLIMEERGNLRSDMRFFREPDLGLRLWLTYNRALINFARRWPGECLVASFRDIAAGAPLVRSLNSRFGLDLTELPNSHIYDPGVSHPRRVPQRVFSADVEGEVQETWEALEHLADCTSGFSERAEAEWNR